MTEHTRVIISDLHIGKNDEFDIFAGPQKSELFESFLEDARVQERPVELVINGDFIDFLQLRPWNDLSRAAALAKMKEIASASSHIFKCLGEFLKDSPHKLMILPGNHDVELAYPEVGEVLRRAILQHAPGAESRYESFDTRKRATYAPLVNGVQVHIEHGNVGDPWNSLDYRALFGDAEIKTEDFDYPPGTKFVYETMNGLKEHLRFVDLLKPEVPAVPLLLLALKPTVTALQIPGFVKQSVASLWNGVVSHLRIKLAGAPLGEGTEDGTVVEDALAATLADTLPEGFITPDDLQYYLEHDEGESAETAAVLGPISDFIKFHVTSTALAGLSRFRKAQEQDEAAFYEKNYPGRKDVKGGRTRLRGEVKVVVFGHTHEALKTEFGEGLYVNSGTWANLIRMPADKKAVMLAWLKGIAANTFEKTSYPTYVKIEPDAGGVEVSLNLWSVQNGQTLWQKSISR